MGYATDNSPNALYPATIACLARHLGSLSRRLTSGDSDGRRWHRMSEALETLSELVASLAHPQTHGAAAGRTLAEIAHVLEPAFAERGIVLEVAHLPSAPVPVDERQIFGCVHLLTHIALDHEPGLEHVFVGVPTANELEVAIRITETGRLDPEHTAALRSEVTFARDHALLALHGSEIRLLATSPRERSWQVVAAHRGMALSLPVEAEGTDDSASGDPRTQTLARQRLATIDEVRGALKRLKAAIAARDSARCADEIADLRRAADGIDGLELEEAGHAAAMAAAAHDLAHLAGVIEDLETALVRYVLNRGDDKTHSVDLHEPIILVADANDRSRTELTRALTDDGFRVLECADADAALTCFEVDHPDAAIVCADLGPRDGFATTRELLMAPGGADLPVLVATHRGDDAAAERALAAGASDYVERPFHFGTVRHRLERLLSASRHAAHARRLARVDHVTGLPNRAEFQSALHRVLEEIGHSLDGFTLIFIDLERFKLVNETMGHDIGDCLLRGVADRLVEAMRDDDVVARLGSDEFAIIARGVTTTEQATRVAEKLVDRVSEPLRVATHEVYTSCTLGMTICPADDSGAITDLMRHADSALFHARNDGLGFAFYEQSMGSRASSRLTLEGDLRKALGTDQFELHFQPQISLKTGLCTGAEGLIRWRHPERGLVSPAEFIPLAEDTGLIIEMGYWVLNEACRFARDIRDLYPDAALERLSINVSSRQMDCPDLVSQIEGALAANGLDGSEIEIEITESAVMKRGDLVLQSLNAIKEMGIRIAIDDFGSGYCSFGYLKKFPIDVLKIDRSLIRDIVDQNDDREIVRAIIALAGSLRLDTVAEGVENLDEITLLRDMGCASVQGFYFSRPLPEDDFAAMFCAGPEDRESDAGEDPRAIVRTA